ncbi:MAG: restriction endonuclease subunit S [Planctomycetota bacterium]
MRDYFHVRDGDHNRLPDEEIVHNSAEGVRYLRAQDLQDGTITAADPVYVTQRYYETISRSHIRPGYLLFSIMGSIGNQAIVPEGFPPATANRAVGILVPKSEDQTLTRFLFQLFLTNLGAQLYQRVKKGGLQKRTNLADVDELEFPLVPEPDRSRIVAAFDAARKARRRKLEEAESLLVDLDGIVLEIIGLKSTSLEPRRVGAIRRKSLDGPLNAERYLENSPAARLRHDASLPLDEVFDVIDEKITPAESAPKKLWACLRIDDLGNEPLDPPNPRRIAGEELVGTFFTTRKADLLIARLGPPLLNGKIVVARECEARTVCSPEFLVLRANGRYDPDVAMWILRSRVFRRVLYSKCRGSTPSRYRLVREELSGVRLPLLSEGQRKRIAAEVARRRDAARRLRDEAARLWDDAKRRFEEELFGAPVPSQRGGR